MANVVVCCVALLTQLPGSSLAQDGATGEQGNRGFLVQVPMPIVDDMDLRIKKSLRQLLETVESGAAARPALVLEFVPAGDDVAPDSSQFERCLSLARFLSSSEMNPLRTVAYLPGEVTGHAVLVVLACEEIVVGGDAVLGPAATDGDPMDATTRQGYLEVASRRRTMAPSLALSLIDPERHLVRAELLDGAKFVEHADLAALQQETTVTSVDTITRPGSAARLDADKLRRYYIASYNVLNRGDLASLLKVARLEEIRLGRDTGWNGLRLYFQGALTAADIASQTRSLQDAIRSESANLVVVHIRSPGGAPQSAARLANHLAELDKTRIHTIAFVESEARGDAWLLAAACDEIVCESGAVLGGPGAATTDSRQADALMAVSKRIAALKGRDWSFSAGLLDRAQEVFLFRQSVTGAERSWTSAEHALREDRDQWERIRPIDLRSGIVSDEAFRLGHVTRIASTLQDAILSFDIPVEELQQHEVPWIVTQVERLAGSPWLARLLLTIGFFALLSEFSAPGLGAPGFTAAVCFLLFFWIQFLNGTADYLELSLFLGGLACVALELFVLPGFGVFGFGGAAMILVSLGLACQTFVIPGNSYQWTQLTSSLFTMIAAISGGIAGAVAMRHCLPNTPYLKKIILEAPVKEADETPTFGYLSGKRGTTITMLRPSGKVMIGDDVVDVITEGEMLDKGVDVVVRDVRGSHIVVRSIDK